MTYHVIKVINGIPYLYEQSGRRVGQKVITTCRCLGRADGTVRESSSSKDYLSLSLDQNEGSLEGGTLNHITSSVSGRAQSGKSSPDDNEGKTFSHGKRQSKETGWNEHKKVFEKIIPDPKPTLKTWIRLKRHNIDREALYVEQRKVFKNLDRIGIDPSSFCSIRVKYGEKISINKTSFGRGYTITMPRDPRKGGRNRIKHEFRKALILSSLDLMKKQRPDIYREVESQFKESYKATQKALSEFLKAQEYYKPEKVHVLKRWGRFQPFKRFTPSAFGLSDTQPRTDWKIEVAGLMAEMMKKGYRKTLRTYQTERFKAHHDMEKCKHVLQNIPWYSITGQFVTKPQNKRRLRRSLARVTAIGETVKRCHFIQSNVLRSFILS